MTWYDWVLLVTASVFCVAAIILAFVETRKQGGR